MLVHYADEYPLPLRLVVFSIILPADTSECERVFSLMNDIKTSERSSMGQQNPLHGPAEPEEPDAVARHGLQAGRGGQEEEDAVRGRWTCL